MKFVSTSLLILLLLIGFTSYSNSLEEGEYHTVVPGENPTTIAENYGVPLELLLNCNNLSTRDKIYPGQRLKICPNESDDLPKQDKKSDQSSQKGTIAKKKSEESSDDPGGKSPEDSGNRTLFFIVAFLLLLFVVAFLLYRKYYCRRVAIPTSQTESENSNSELLKIQNWIQQLKKQNVQLHNQFKLLQQQFNDLRVYVTQLEALLKQSKSNSTEPTMASRNKIELKESYANMHTTSYAQATQSILYASSISDNCFSGITSQPNLRTIYKLQLESSSNAVVHLYQEAFSRIIANPDLIEGCDIQVVKKDKIIEVRSTGLAQKDSSTGLWVVLKKMDILIK